MNYFDIAFFSLFYLILFAIIPFSLLLSNEHQQQKKPYEIYFSTFDEIQNLNIKPEDIPCIKPLKTENAIKTNKLS